MKILISTSMALGFNEIELRRELKDVILDDFGIPTKDATIEKSTFFDPKVSKYVSSFKVTITLKVRGAPLPFQFHVYKSGSALVLEDSILPVHKIADNILDLLLYVRTKIPPAARQRALD